VGRTLLIGHPGVSWREWLKEHRGNSDLLCLDPNEPSLGTPARLVLLKEHRPTFSRFYGSLDPQKGPHVVLAALAQAMPNLSEDAKVLLPPYRPTPLLRQLVSLAAQIVRPTEILVGKGTPLAHDGLPIGPEEVELEAAFPPLVQQAQRKAQWMKLLENSEMHEVSLREVSVEGARFGSGTILSADERKTAGLGVVLHAEKMGATLFIVAEGEVEEAEIARALDFTHCTKAQFAEPSWFENLLCSFARQSGEDFGMGMVQSMDWNARTARILCTAVPPAPVRILRLGTLRVDRTGRELGELRPWQV